MRTSKALGIIGGLLIFVLAYLVLHLGRVPPLGFWDRAFTVLGWTILLTVTVRLTQGWAAALFLAAGEIMTLLSFRMMDLSGRQGWPWAAFVSFGFDLAGWALGLIGLFLIVRAVVKELRRTEP